MNEADPYDRGLSELAATQTVENVYDVLDRVCDAVVARTPCMVCEPGCSECCRQQVLAGFAEWQVALAWIHAHLSPAQQRAAVARAERLLADPDSALQTWLDLKDQDRSSAAYLEAINAALENHSTPCPLLVDGRCSIHPARPAICRAYGRMMRTEEGAYYCDPILNRMRDASPDLEEIVLPVFQPYHRAVLEDGAGELDEVNVLPIWILAHRAPDGTMARVAHRIDPRSRFPVIDGYWSFDDGS